VSYRNEPAPTPILRLITRAESFFGFSPELTAREFYAQWPRRLLFCAILVAIGALIGIMP